MGTCDVDASGAQDGDAGPRSRRPGRRLRLLVARMREDLDVVLDKDPAAHSRLEVLLYPHIHALWLHRVAHWLYGHHRTLAARAVSLYARRRTGVEIHPGATIGRRFFVDHGAAVVIGETVVIGDDVMLYHQVTLGSVGWWKDLGRASGARRHPVIGDRVVIGTNASVLGPITVDADCLIGAHVVLTDSVPAGSRVFLPPAMVQPRSARAAAPGSPESLTGLTEEPPQENAPAPAVPHAPAPPAAPNVPPAVRLVRTTKGPIPR